MNTNTEECEMTTDNQELDSLITAFVEEVRVEVRTRGRPRAQFALFAPQEGNGPGWRRIVIDYDDPEFDSHDDVFWAANRLARMLNAAAAALPDCGSAGGPYVFVERRGAPFLEIHSVGPHSEREVARQLEPFHLVKGAALDEGMAWEVHDDLRRFDHHAPVAARTAGDEKVINAFVATFIEETRADCQRGNDHWRIALFARKEYGEPGWRTVVIDCGEHEFGGDLIWCGNRMARILGAEVVASTSWWEDEPIVYVERRKAPFTETYHVGSRVARRVPPTDNALWEDEFWFVKGLVPDTGWAWMEDHDWIHLARRNVDLHADERGDTPPSFGGS